MFFFSDKDPFAEQEEEDEEKVMDFGGVSSNCLLYILCQFYDS